MLYYDNYYLTVTDTDNITNFHAVNICSQDLSHVTFIHIFSQLQLL